MVVGCDIGGFLVCSPFLGELDFVYKGHAGHVVFFNKHIVEFKHDSCERV